MVVKRAFNLDIYRCITCMLIFSLSLIPRIINLDEPGLTWDEPAYMGAARNYISGILKLQVFEISTWEANWEHPPIAKYLIGVSLHILEPFGFSEVSAARVPNTILGSLTCLLLYLFLHDVYGESVAILASLLLSYLPRFFADTRFASLDAPQTFFVVFSIYAFKKGIKTKRLKWMFISASLCGLALSVKISALSLPFILLVWFIITHWNQSWGRKITPKSLILIISFFLLAFATFILSWPLIWIDPKFIVRYLNFHIYHFNIPVYYLGEVYQRAPWHYPFIMLFATTPVGVSLAAVFGGFYALKNALKYKRDDVSILLLAWLTLTLLRVSVSYGYDGVRLFLDALPPFSSLAAIGVMQLNTLLHKLPSFIPKKLKKVLFCLLSLLLIISEIYACTVMHPYETSYYNELVMAFNMVRLFEKTYWGEVYKEVIEWLEARDPGANVVVPIAPHLARYYAKTLKITDNIFNIFGERPAYLAFQAREGFYFDSLINSCLDNLKPIHTVQVNGIIIAYVFNLSDYYSLIEVETTNSSYNITSNQRNLKGY